jgi:predicted ATPase/transcriptional regulator with XRE-family HTH domain
MDGNGAPVEKFGDLLRRLRVESDLTQEALAERAGLSVRAISDLERGVKRGPRPDTMRMLADGLGLSGDARSAFATAARRDAIPPGPRRQPRPAETPGAALAPTAPPALADLIGRDRELTDVTGLLGDGGARLVTLTGPGGVGKTTLALAALARLGSLYPDGRTVVELASIRDPALLVPAIASARGLRDAGETDPEQTLIEHLRTRRCLLVLDNCEQVLAPVGALVGRLLAGCPALRVLATSRARLGLRSEREVALAPLSLPATGEERAPERLLENPAVRLFAERARDADPGFALTRQNAATITEVVRRLDGLPLAIELAAARSKVLPPAALLARLQRRLPLLTGGARDLPERQQTLRNAIAWSYDLLDADQQALFRRLAVFAGGFTLEAAETVGRSDGETEGRWSGEEPWVEGGEDITFDLTVLSGMEELTRSSLVVRDQSVEADAEPRFHMLETIREFGLEKLAAEGEEADARRRHADWYLALVERADPELNGRDQPLWLTRLAAEHSNLRAALDWLLEQSDPTPALALAAGLWRYWWVRGHIAEGRDWLNRALDRGGAEPAVRAKAERSAAMLAGAQGDLAASARHAERAIDLGRASHQLIEIARALIELGRVAGLRGEHERATACYEESLALYRELGVRAGVPDVLSELGTLAFLRGDFDAAAVRYEESLSICRDLGDEQAIVVALGHLGEALQRAGRSGAAEGLFAEALVRARAIDDRQGIAAALVGLGLVARARGDENRAVARFLEGLAVARDMDDTFEAARCLEELASSKVATGNLDLAARLFGAAEALREATGAPLPAPLRVDIDRDLASLRAALDPEVFAVAWMAGRVRPLDETLAVIAPAPA